MLSTLEQSLKREVGDLRLWNKLCLLHKNIISRCYYEAGHAYHIYGARGIKVAKAWHTRPTFIKWALKAKEKAWLTLDRINVNGDYSPSNCRWIPLAQQANNRQNTVRLTLHGKTKLPVEWAKELGIELGTIYKRLQYGLPTELVLLKGRVGAWKHGTRAGYEFHKCRCEACTASNTLRHKLRRGLK